MRIVTNGEIEYRPAGTLHRFIIPAGTPCIDADNLPYRDGDRKYWACDWEGMTDEEASWGRNYGFLLHSLDVEDRVEAVCRAAL